MRIMGSQVVLIVKSVNYADKDILCSELILDRSAVTLLGFVCIKNDLWFRNHIFFMYGILFREAIP